jgi:phosphoribosylformimino-5-aminoimidazole carboxamide ribotide isomerase
VGEALELFPAIDVRDGRCVRLRRGDYAEETVYGDDPVGVAVAFVASGARWVHVVDLDAARSGEPVNRAVITATAAAVRDAGGRVQAGGGVRDEAAARALWDAGVTRVVLGTAAVRSPGLVAELAGLRPGGVAVGLDARAGQLAVEGWLESTGTTTEDVVTGLAGSGVAAFVVTDISRDGMLAGPDVDGLGAVLDATTVDVIASGGVASAGDIAALAAVRGPRSGRRLAGVVVGRALYEGRLTVAEGVAACAASA